MTEALIVAKMKAELESIELGSPAREALGVVYESYDNVPAQSQYSFPCAVIDWGSGQPDAENPDLGEDRLDVHLYFKDYARAGKGQVTDQYGLGALLRKIRRDHSYFAGGDWGPGVVLDGVGQPERLLGEKGQQHVEVWTAVLNYKVISG